MNWVVWAKKIQIVNISSSIQHDICGVESTCQMWIICPFLLIYYWPLGEMLLLLTLLLCCHQNLQFFFSRHIFPLASSIITNRNARVRLYQHDAHNIHIAHTMHTSVCMCATEIYHQKLFYVRFFHKNFRNHRNLFGFNFTVLMIWDSIDCCYSICS